MRGSAGSSFVRDNYNDIKAIELMETILKLNYNLLKVLFATSLAHLLVNIPIASFEIVIKSIFGIFIYELMHCRSEGIMASSIETNFIMME